MRQHENRRYTGPRNVMRTSKVIVVLFGLAALGYVAVTVIEHAGPLLSAASSFMLESRMVNPEPPIDAADAQAASGAASAAMPITPATSDGRAFDYFPDHYVNQATKIADPVATF